MCSNHSLMKNYKRLLWRISYVRFRICLVENTVQSKIAWQGDWGSRRWERFLIKGASHLVGFLIQRLIAYFEKVLVTRRVGRLDFEKYAWLETSSRPSFSKHFANWLSWSDTKISEFQAPRFEMYSTQTLRARRAFSCHHSQRDRRCSGKQTILICSTMQWIGKVDMPCLKQSYQKSTR